MVEETPEVRQYLRDTQKLLEENGGEVLMSAVGINLGRPPVSGVRISELFSEYPVHFRIEGHGPRITLGLNVPLPTSSSVVVKDVEAYLKATEQLLKKYGGSARMAQVGAGVGKPPVADVKHKIFFAMYPQLFYMEGQAGFLTLFLRAQSCGFGYTPGDATESRQKPETGERAVPRRTSSPVRPVSEVESGKDEGRLVWSVRDSQTECSSGRGCQKISCQKRHPEGLRPLCPRVAACSDPLCSNFHVTLHPKNGGTIPSNKLKNTAGKASAVRACLQNDLEEQPYSEYCIKDCESEGGCPHGDRCRYLHVLSSMRDKQRELDESLLCSFKKKCLNFSCQKEHPNGRRSPCPKVQVCSDPLCWFLHVVLQLSDGSKIASNHLQNSAAKIAAVREKLGSSEKGGKGGGRKLRMCTEGPSCPNPNACSDLHLVEKSAANAAKASDSAAGGMPPSAILERRLSHHPLPECVAERDSEEVVSLTEGIRRQAWVNGGWEEERGEAAMSPPLSFTGGLEDHGERMSTPPQKKATQPGSRRVTESAAETRPPCSPKLSQSRDLREKGEGGIRGLIQGRSMPASVGGSDLGSEGRPSLGSGPGARAVRSNDAQESVEKFSRLIPPEAEDRKKQQQQEEGESRPVGEYRRPMQRRRGRGVSVLRSALRVTPLVVDGFGWGILTHRDPSALDELEEFLQEEISGGAGDGRELLIPRDGRFFLYPNPAEGRRLHVPGFDSAEELESHVMFLHHLQRRGWTWVEVEMSSLAYAEKVGERAGEGQGEMQRPGRVVGRCLGEVAARACEEAEYEPVGAAVREGMEVGDVVLVLADPGGGSGSASSSSSSPGSLWEEEGEGKASERIGNDLIESAAWRRWPSLHQQQQAHHVQQQSGSGGRSSSSGHFGVLRWVVFAGNGLRKPGEAVEEWGRHTRRLLHF
uniref:C3H1-type domain-containing protein n=1 Tax=Chromera velia CCMP2878 TaxID=1169474 RepID=A0A0G4FT87_9ALVE|eukprot:Cvel_18637.t1-p1 / transcript=Cvel_18637.t1 / gene=Cvel_18637 / organism=Chromera_velia_CCMP2878 / gene_product=hypothetical protein / transcript_product=hypothetical protein / location=Cvel_scaffold1557:2340-5775(-) / protein_length=924 / sequence_SO=supercontig / SO=protein_coding / is_pseudo=false